MKADINKVVNSINKIFSNPANAKLLSGNNNTIISGNKNTVIHGDYNVNVKKINRPKVTCPPGSINEKQIKRIDDLTKELAEIEIQAGMDKGKAYSKWRAAFKNRYSLSSYRCLPSEKFDEAEAWLLQQRAIKQPKLRRRDNDTWRKNKYKGIYARARELGVSKDEILSIAIRKFGKEIKSISELGERNLDKLYKIIFSL